MKISTKRFLVCPGCDKYEFNVEHLLDDPNGGRNFGPWSCDNDNCNKQISGIVLHGEITTLTVTERKDRRGFALLKLGDLYMVREEKYGCVGNPDFFYHSHQCPANLLRSVSDVYDETGRDPHARIRFIGSIDATPETRAALADAVELPALFELFQTNGEPDPDTEWPEEDRGMLPFIADWQRQSGKLKT